MTRKCLYFLLMFIIVTPGFLAGCIGGNSQKSVYYVFSPSQEQITAKSVINDHSIGIGPIKIPGFLKRPQIVTRQEENVLTINEFHRWGDSLEAQITGTLIENLTTLLNTPNVIAHPWERPFDPEYQIYIDFRRFEGDIREGVNVEAVWWIVATKENKKLFTQRSSLTESMGGEGLKAYVASLNTALDKLSREIAKGLLDALAKVD